VASIPFELLASDADLTILAILKTPRLFRIGRILRYFEHVRYANFVRIGRVFVAFFVLVHWIGCLWVFVADRGDWTDLNDDHVYLRAIADATSMLVGNNMNPRSHKERVFAL
jgi:potassium voltage-gated channel Eag-related subfamily H protein 6